MTNPATLWQAPPDSLALTGEEVDVWRIELDRPARQVEKLLGTLSPDERDRAARFYFDRDREHFIVARGACRAILGRYLRAEPYQLRFSYTEYGKPSLVEGLNPDSIRFNLSHSHGLGLLALSRGREIGIDLEFIRAGPAGEGIAERFFCANEVDALHELPSHQQDEAFFNCWTRKEAYIKAKGEGLSMPLDRFAVSLVPGEPAALLSTVGDSEEASRWRLRELFPAPGFAAAIAVEGDDWRLRCWEWQQ